MAKEEKNQAPEQEVKDTIQEEKTEQQPSKKEQKKEMKKVEDLEKKLAEAQKAAEAAEAKAQDAKEDYLRLMAEFETFRRRNAEEKLSLVASAASDTIKGFLPVLDDLDAAMKVLEQSEDKSGLEGISLIYNKLIAYLKSCGLEPIDALGQDFDTDFHEALTQVPAPTPEQKGKVVEVFKAGYTFKGKVLRYAKVVVGA